MAQGEEHKSDLQRALSSVGSYVAAREDQLTELIERTAGKVDARTEHRYTSTIDKLRNGLQTGITKLAEQKGDEEGPEPQDPAHPEGPPLS